MRLWSSPFHVIEPQTMQDQLDNTETPAQLVDRIRHGHIGDAVAQSSAGWPTDVEGEHKQVPLCAAQRRRPRESSRREASGESRWASYHQGGCEA